MECSPLGEPRKLRQELLLTQPSLSGLGPDRTLKDFPKLPWATSFIGETLSAIAWLLYYEVL